MLKAISLIDSLIVDNFVNDQIAFILVNMRLLCRQVST